MHAAEGQAQGLKTRQSRLPVAAFGALEPGIVGGSQGRCAALPDGVLQPVTAAQQQWLQNASGRGGTVSLSSYNGVQSYLTTTSACWWRPEMRCELSTRRSTPAVWVSICCCPAPRVLHLNPGEVFRRDLALTAPAIAAQLARCLVCSNAVVEAGDMAMQRGRPAAQPVVADE